ETASRPLPLVVVGLSEVPLPVLIRPRDELGVFRYARRGGRVDDAEGRTGGRIVVGMSQMGKPCDYPAKSGILHHVGQVGIVGVLLVSHWSPPSRTWRNAGATEMPAAGRCGMARPGIRRSGTARSARRRAPGT